MTDAPDAPGRANKQDRNVGNLGDILKHAALVALADLMAPHQHLRYLETHAYRLIAPCNAERWHEKLRSLPQGRAYERYAALEKRWVGGRQYRCSVGLALDVLPHASLILAEEHRDTRRRLDAQLAEQNADYLLLDNASAFGRLAGSRTGPGLALVDPFRSIHECWPAFCRGFVALCGGHDALILVFQYKSGAVDWPSAPLNLALVASVDNGPFHLASFATPAMCDVTRVALASLGWRGQLVPTRSIASEPAEIARPTDEGRDVFAPEDRLSGPVSPNGDSGLQGFVRVFAKLHSSQTRVTYIGLGVVAHHCGLCGNQEIGRPSSYRFIRKLPLDQQYLICRTDGTYSDTALAQWEQVAPPGYLTFRILTRDELERQLGS